MHSQFRVLRCWWCAISAIKLVTVLGPYGLVLAKVFVLIISVVNELWHFVYYLDFVVCYSALVVGSCRKFVCYSGSVACSSGALLVLWLLWFVKW